LALSMRPEQRMLLLPRMLQALDVLQLPRLALDDLVAAAVAENEALRARPTKRRADRARGDRGAIDDAPARSGTLRDHLVPQLAGVDAPPRVAALVRYVVDSLDAAGHRGVQDDELAKTLDPPAAADEIAACDDALRGLDPLGVGARGPIEAILWQLRRDDPDRSSIEVILRRHLEALAKGRRSSVAAEMGVDDAELARLLERVRTLDPRPGAALGGDAAPRVRPDVVVRTVERGFQLEVDDAYATALTLDPAVAAAARSRATPPRVRAHLRRRVEAARVLLGALEQRRRTLERVACAVFEEQGAFLQLGPRALRPLRMQDLAARLGVHASTVSRAVADKYAETPWGVVRLREFFGAGVARASGARDSRENLKDAIRDALAREDRRRPLGDDEVVSRLRERGWEVARRTVAKYRAELGIPSSWRRREAAPAGDAVEATSSP
ncbi:MAG TPA: RNA polymerase factor sigma-54, partial [Planctomycetota bacterium]|nr:RNA polymerase factor sigma-54 [Planctomycetota bacterium]